MCALLKHNIGLRWLPPVSIGTMYYFSSSPVQVEGQESSTRIFTCSGKSLFLVLSSILSFVLFGSFFFKKKSTLRGTQLF